MELKLIKVVKRHPCLFDRSSTDFRNQYLKEEAWVAAAISTGASVEQCKQRWKSLRDRFVREVVSQQSKPESAAKEKNKWCYFELLSFLTKHVNPRKMKSKRQSSIDDQSISSYSPATTQSDSCRTTDCEWMELQQDTGEPNDSQSSFETPTSKKAPKRRRLGEEPHEPCSQPAKQKPENKAFLVMLDELLQKKPAQVQESKNNTHESFNHLCGTLEKVFSAKKESKNKAFLAMLDELLQKKPEEVQEKLKMEVLNHVHNS
ncbi:uncharacterized protein LOC105224281 [Bactrocera dorsalis]|uniref:Uncharacterized protein LOC105224281 n=1 Tax=Bactrocera dorsalis TaxID=27457 RepID=A0ABM3JWW8_BACDO|nr:uncharacterized protein LOC105224281 [Bactrocera dorsalis]XP_049313727.1 uncharacterized protein LOC105224281 [Bactrocera dorsalis]XP_049313728.1 uncharacterized protein LOC105224281 [Bactrocera dorsalis]